MKNKLLKLCHITPHVGGGVGAVIKDFISSSFSDYEHTLLCLDKCTTNFDDIIVNGLKLESLSYGFHFSVENILSNSDIVIIHYWNHPLLAKFIVTNAVPACRLLIWCHNSGLQEPHIIPSYLVEMAAKIMFTSQCSINAPNLQNDIKKNPEKFCTVHSTHDLTAFNALGLTRKLKKTLTRLLYVGTVSKSKMHVDSAQILAKLSQLGFCICVVGGPDHQKLQQEVLSLGGEIQVTGFNQSVLPFYEEADLFIYPLRPDHYGTGEQVILEAMASGLPVVAFNNPAEMEIIINGETGFLVNTSDRFIDSISEMALDHDLYEIMSKSSMDRISYKFSSFIMNEKISDQVSDVMKINKTVPYRPDDVFGVALDEFDAFILSSFFDATFYLRVNKDKSEKVNYIFSKIKESISNSDKSFFWLSSTKSSPYHYLSYFHNNEEFVALTRRINRLLSDITCWQ